MNIEKIYRESKGLLEGHFLLSSGKHSNIIFRVPSCLKNQKLAGKIWQKPLGGLRLRKVGIEIDTICGPRPRWYIERL